MPWWISKEERKKMIPKSLPLDVQKTRRQKGTKKAGWEGGGEGKHASFVTKYSRVFRGRPEVR